MTWVMLMISAAFLQAAKDAFLKRAMAGMDVLVATWSYCLVTSVLLAGMLFSSGFPPVGARFWWLVTVSGVFGGLNLVLYITAVKASDLSLTLPMLALSPLFMLITSPLMIGEFPDPAGLFGIVLIVAGSYALNLRRFADGFFAPFKALLDQKGPRLMLLVSFLWSLFANVDRMGLDVSAPIPWVFSTYFATTVFLTPLVLWRAAAPFSQVRRHPREILAAGLFEAVSLAFQMYALTMTLVAYVIAVKRLSAVFGVLIGALIFKESGLAERLFGAALMVAGVFFIALLG
ncbi:EamA family transporter [Desulfovibrio sulfodismutans]|uniref:EamA family transporter n=2 Tax=Desulfolutivibrio sulfodismutans TaxID=63561 RepID=A0A7K3NLY7_9BACT|nr:EamA family transporter [Desulfolutivibrio sulfodismutans]QLA13844.1 EamA family transporter [Desulfolutivibrio sulfodismutans DSM 3696]